MKRYVYYIIALICLLTIGGVAYLAFRPSKQQLSNKYKKEIVTEFRAAGKIELARDISRLKGIYTKPEWSQIAEAYQNGTIRNGSLSEDLLLKLSWGERDSRDNLPLNGLKEICDSLQKRRNEQAMEQAMEEALAKRKAQENKEARDNKNNDSKGRRTITAFENANDVLNYLMSHSFTNSNGLTLTFRPEGMFCNDLQLTRAITIRNISSYKATITATTIFGDGGIGVYYLDSQAGTITDSVNGDAYFVN